MSGKTTRLYITDEFEKMFHGTFLSEVYKEVSENIAVIGILVKFNNPTANLDKTIDRQYLLDHADANNEKAFKQNQIPVHVKLNATDFIIDNTGIDVYRKKTFVYAFLELGGIVEFNDICYMGKSDSWDLLKAIIKYEKEYYQTNN